MGDRNTVASEIIDFWYVIELLNQEAFPVESHYSQTIKKDILNKIKYKPGIKFTSKKYNHISLYHYFKGNVDCIQFLEVDQRQYPSHPETSRQLHLCFGKMNKMTLVEKLYKILNIEDKEPEKINGSVVLWSLKMDAFGEYERDSFRLSPFLWGIYKCLTCPSASNRGISHIGHLEEIKDIQNQFAENQRVDNSFLSFINSYLGDHYLKPLGLENKYMQEGVLNYTRYVDETVAKNLASDEEDVSELFKSYYADDLAYVRDEVLKKSGLTKMQNAVLDYVLSQHDTLSHIPNRVDIRTDKQALESALNFENISLAKWPTRYNASLMQQVAINTAIHENAQETIFAINGPPGTGKTTLLKDVIAHNIFERALKLSKYKCADDAFIEQTPSQIDKNSKLVTYYAFKDESLSQYNMLVASNNNAAVENITVDLPNQEDLLKGLACSDEDSTETQKGLNDVSNLFDLKENDATEYFWEQRLVVDPMSDGKKEKPQNFYEEKKDIFFSWLAHKRMTQNQDLSSEEVGTWGLISAPLGKQSNISRYYYNVLLHFYRDEKQFEEMSDQHHKAFVATKVDFENQYQKVNLLKREILSDLNFQNEVEETIRTLEYEIDNYDNEIISCSRTIHQIKDRIASTQSQLSHTKVSIEELEKQFYAIGLAKEEITLDIKTCEEEIDLLENFILDVTNKISFWDNLKYKLFKIKSTYHEDIEHYGDRIHQNKKNRVELNTLKLKNNRQSLEIQNNLVRVVASEKDSQRELSQLEDDKHRIELELEKLQKKIDDINTVIIGHRQSIIDKWEAIKKNSDVIDDQFWDIYFSDNKAEKIKSELINPWVTEIFNREREKLFYASLKLIEYFVLSSKACRQNLILISRMWGLLGQETYSNQIKDSVFTHLLNTVFLVTPVISTTFASVGKFLKHVNKPGSIGTLIVDEAGQATPQIALGALWRANQAIIVGDMNQVEPVVTTEAAVLMRAFSNDSLRYYRSKTLSVQQLADTITPLGTYLQTSANGQWVGCPLVVHRRCIEPMFSISNELSYANTMFYQTAKPSASLNQKFLLDQSCWFDIEGTERGHKNHFVEVEAVKVAELVKQRFRIDRVEIEESEDYIPSLYIISPFKTVVNGLKHFLEKDSELSQYSCLPIFLEENLGTVHKFQGKEANEVIFILGCDQSAMGAVRWVNKNIINVAVTRGKYRIYFVGSAEIWQSSSIFEKAQTYVNLIT